MSDGHGPPADTCSVPSLREQVASYPFWYHTLELGRGVVTPGEWDLRPTLPHLPWPDVAGKRCLDVGTFNGFFAFELERRGAAEVVAVDLLDPKEIDWPRDARPGTGKSGWEDKFAGTDFTMDGGFRIAAAALGSAVEWRHCSIYDLDPGTLGTFDVVVCGSLVLHLRDPIRALEAVRSVCSGVFLSSEAIDLWLSVLRVADHRPPASTVSATRPSGGSPTPPRAGEDARFRGIRGDASISTFSAPLRPRPRVAALDAGARCHRRGRAVGHPESRPRPAAPGRPRPSCGLTSLG